MIKKSILIENKTSISLKNQQLVIKSEIRESSIPVEDIGFLVLDNQEIYISIPAMNYLIENNTAVIICNTNDYDFFILQNQQVHPNQKNLHQDYKHFQNPIPS